MRLKRWHDQGGALARQLPIATRGRQGRFLLAILLCWSGARAYWLWPQAAIPGGLPAFLEPIDPEAVRRFTPFAAFSPPFEPRAAPPRVRKPSPYRRVDWSSPVNAARWLLLQLGGGETVSATRAMRRATFAYIPPPEDSETQQQAASPAPLFPTAPAPRGSRIEAQAYLYWRPGGGPSSLAEHGELGGSQFAARIAVPLGHGLAAAGRIYAPLEHRGAEAAIGLDWHLLPGQPIRISVERRQRLDALGRSAWSAYAAGGFWRGGGPGKPVIDGYAQAGVVGTQRRDLFVDGALRLGYQLPTHGPSVTVGAGLWGAAQPQVSRLDMAHASLRRFPWRVIA